MNIYGYIACGAGVLLLCVLGYWALTSHIETKANEIATIEITKSKIEMQNQAIEQMAIMEAEYKEKIAEVEKKIEKQVPQVTTTKDSTCEARLAQVSEIVNSVWFASVEAINQNEEVEQ